MSARVTSLAVVPSQRPTSLLHQLCKAFGQRCESQFDSDRGYIEFGFGRCELRAERRRLTVTVSAWDSDGCERVRRLVNAPLTRAARGEGAPVHWR